MRLKLRTVKNNGDTPKIAVYPYQLCVGTTTNHKKGCEMTMMMTVTPQQMLIISTIVFLLAIQLPTEQKSVILQYNDRIITWLIGVVLQKESGETICILAQLGALLLLRKLYTQVLRPIHLLLSTDGYGNRLKGRYGSWAVIVGDLNFGDVSLMREFAGNLVSRGMNVLILDCSIDVSVSVGNNGSSNSLEDEEKEKEEREEKLRNEVVKLFMEDLRKRASKDDDDDDTIDSSNVNGDDDLLDDNNDNGNEQSKRNICAVEIMRLKGGTLPNFCSNVIKALGDMAKNGGIGMCIHCFSSKQAVSLPAQSKKKYAPSCKKNGAETFLSILNLILPYMLFRGTGAIINVCREDFSEDQLTGLFASNTVFDQSSKARGKAECAFYRQLVRSLHYEYREHGIDVLAVTLSEEGGIHDEDVVVRSSLQMLGEDSELDLKICWYNSILKSLLGLSK